MVRIISARHSLSCRAFFYEDCVFGEFLIKQIVSSDKELFSFFVELKRLKEDQKFLGHQPYRFFDGNSAELAPLQCFGIHQSGDCGVAV